MKSSFIMESITSTNAIDALRELLKGDFDFHEQSSNDASHNFHSFPAKFPPELPRKLISELTSEGDIVLDPMIGSGTTAVEAYLLNRKALGFDIDPLALIIARVKTTPLDKQLVLNSFMLIKRKVVDRLSKSPDYLRSEIIHQFGPETIKFMDTWYLKPTQAELFALSQEILNIQDEKIRDFFVVAFSATIITKSGGVSLALDLGHTRPHRAKKVVDKNGNILIGETDQYYPRHSVKIMRTVLPEFEKKCLANLGGLPSVNEHILEPEIKFGDSQNLPLADDSIDLIVTSPPYASNAIDYMRAHKFSLVWFGYPIEALSEKRKEYIGGESTTHFVFEELPAYSQSIVNKVQARDKKKAQVLHRYFSEMTRVLKEMHRVLKSQKSSIVVVGNSNIKGVNAEIPYCLAEIGQNIGFKVPIVGVRELNRDKRMLPVGSNINSESQIQQRMHEEYLIGFFKP